MGLLTAPLSLAREPLRLTLRAWEFGLASVAEAARIGAELLDPDNAEPPPDVAEPWAPRATVGDNGRPAQPDATAEPEVTVAPDLAPQLPDVPDAPPAVPDELIPSHVDEDPVLVAEAAEEGAAEGAGAELHVEPPWDGYDQMTAADICDRLAAGTHAQAAAVELYEASQRSRRSVMDAAERALRA